MSTFRNDYHNRNGIVPSLLVIHDTESSNFKGDLNVLQATKHDLTQPAVSVHYLVSPTGEVADQSYGLVDPIYSARHAGISLWKDKLQIIHENTAKTLGFMSLADYLKNKNITKDIASNYIHELHIQNADNLQLDHATNLQYKKNGKEYNLDNVQDIDLAQISDITLYKADNVKINQASIIDIIPTPKLNDISIGIEMTNPGDIEFTSAQTTALATLCTKILLHYNISAVDMMSHADIAPNRKQDPSGYFSWRLLYEQIYHNLSDQLANAKITNIEKANSLCSDLKELIAVMNIQSSSADTILLKPGSEEVDEIKCLQTSLRKYGYSYVGINGRYDDNLMNTIISFNRHFCPEIFIKEKIIKGRTIIDPKNKQWYQLSQLRLEELLANFTD